MLKDWQKLKRGYKMSNKLLYTLNLKTLSKEVKEKIYQKLLKGTYEASIMLDGKHLAQIKFKNNDLCLSSWNLNFYVRTPKAVKSERYKTLDYAVAELYKMIKRETYYIGSNICIYYNSYLFGTPIFYLEQ